MNVQGIKKKYSSAVTRWSTFCVLNGYAGGQIKKISSQSNTFYSVSFRIFFLWYFFFVYGKNYAHNRPSLILKSR